jgi:hypothetical protein
MSSPSHAHALTVPNSGKRSCGAALDGLGFVYMVFVAAGSILAALSSSLGFSGNVLRRGECELARVCAQLGHRASRVVCGVELNDRGITSCLTIWVTAAATLECCGALGMIGIVCKPGAGQ